MNVSGKHYQAVPLIRSSRPVDRTAAYLGVSSKSVREAVEKFETTGQIPPPKLGALGRRGKYRRYPAGRLYIAELRRFSFEMNAAGIPVTIRRLQKRLRDFGWTDGLSAETVRKTMVQIGFNYKRAGRTQNFTETEDIQRKRIKYLTDRNDPKQYVKRFFQDVLRLREMLRFPQPA